nr:PREDICTED: uncharacterized protein LOC109036840 [Bemisia tabaci]
MIGPSSQMKKTVSQVVRNEDGETQDCGFTALNTGLKTLKERLWLGGKQEKIIPIEKPFDQCWKKLNLYDSKTKFKKGDLLVSPHGRLMLAIGKTHYVRLPWSYSFWQSYTWLIELEIPIKKEKDGKESFVWKMLDPPQEYNPNRAVALAKLLLGKRLPFYYCTCHDFHWMDYICYDKVQKNALNYRCPLARSLNGVRIDKDLYLENALGRRTYVDGLATVTLDENYEPLPEDQQPVKPKRGGLARFASSKNNGAKTGANVERSKSMLGNKGFESPGSMKD